MNGPTASELAPELPPGNDEAEMRFLNLKELVKQREHEIGIKTAPKWELVSKTFAGDTPLIGDLDYRRLSQWYMALEVWDAERSAAEASGDQDKEDRENLRVLVAERESALGIKVADKNKLKRLTFGGDAPPIADLGLERLSAWYDALDQWGAEKTAAASEQKQDELAGT